MAELLVRVFPRASREKIDVMPDGQIRVYVTAPPVDGEANAAVVALVSERLNCRARDVEVLRGHTSRNKILRVPGELAEVLGRMKAGGK